MAIFIHSQDYLGSLWHDATKNRLTFGLLFHQYLHRRLNDDDNIIAGFPKWRSKKGAKKEANGRKTGETANQETATPGCSLSTSHLGSDLIIHKRT